MISETCEQARVRYEQAVCRKATNLGLVYRVLSGFCEGRAQKVVLQGIVLVGGGRFFGHGTLGSGIVWRKRIGGHVCSREFIAGRRPYGRGAPQVSRLFVCRRGDEFHRGGPAPDAFAFQALTAN